MNSFYVHWSLLCIFNLSEPPSPTPYTLLGWANSSETSDCVCAPWQWQPVLPALHVLQRPWVSFHERTQDCSLGSRGQHSTWPLSMGGGPSSRQPWHSLTEEELVKAIRRCAVEYPALNSLQCTFIPSFYFMIQAQNSKRLVSASQICREVLELGLHLLCGDSLHHLLIAHFPAMRIPNSLNTQ